MAETENGLVTIPDDLLDGAPGALAVYSAPLEKFEEGPLGVLIAALAKRADAFRKTATIETRAGRDEIASFAYRLARAKTTLEAAGKDVADKLKDLPKKVDANRRRVREAIEGMQTKVRAPLTAYEATEKARTEKHLAAIERLRATGATEFPLSTTSAEIQSILTAIQEMTIDESTCEEFATDYRLEREQACARLASALLARQRYEADQAELARLRAAAEAQEAAERERQAEASRIERERQAEIDREREAREAAEMRERTAETARITAENEARLAAERTSREAAEREAAELRRQDAARAAEERERQAEASRQERARQAEIDAERNAREAAERATREAEAARLRAENDARIAAERTAREAAEREAAELRRQEASRAAEAAEAEKRERSIKHRAAVHREAADAINNVLRDVGFGVASLEPDQVSVAIVKAIAKQQVPGITVEY